MEEWKMEIQLYVYILSTKIHKIIQISFKDTLMKIYFASNDDYIHRHSFILILKVIITLTFVIFLQLLLPPLIPTFTYMNTLIPSH